MPIELSAVVIELTTEPTVNDVKNVLIAVVAAAAFVEIAPNIAPQPPSVAAPFKPKSAVLSAAIRPSKPPSNAPSPNDVNAHCTI